MTTSSHDPARVIFMASSRLAIAKFEEWIRQELHEVDKDKALYFAAQLEAGRYPPWFLSRIAANSAVALGLVFA